MLELYQYETCPYCVVVRRRLSELAVDYICRNAPPGPTKGAKPVRESTSMVR